MRTRSIVATLTVAIATSLAIPAAAFAHGLPSPPGIPVPGYVFAYAAAAVLAGSFFALSRLWQQPRLEGARTKPLFAMPRVVDITCGAVGITAFGAVLYAGLIGTNVASRNLEPTVVYVLFWVGLVPLSVLAGDVFAAFNPWRALGRALGWSVNRVGGDLVPPPLPYPARLGRWPAVAGLLGFAWLELIYVHRDAPTTIAHLAIAYTVIQLIGMSLFGVETWRIRGDSFSVYFGLFARMAAFVRERRRLSRRTFLSGLTLLDVVPGTIAFVCVMIGATSFDGLSATVPWIDTAPHVAKLFARAGASPTVAVELTSSLGLLFMIGLIAVVYYVGLRGMRSVDTSHGLHELAYAFVHALVPIACGYVLAHYFTFLIFQGQAIGALVSDPLGNGSDLFGTARATIDYGLISNSGVWYFQVGALVLGHVASLVLAHDRALVVYDNPRTALRSQRWILVVMVGYTSLGLFLLSSARR
jgi:hypothetical protein